MKKLFFAASVLLLASCEDIKVEVNCVTTGAPAVECEVHQRAGKKEVEVCWDFEAKCANGEVVKAERTCAKVKDGGDAKATTPADKLSNVDKCGGDKPPEAKVSNLTIDGKKAQ
jgi:hypothetical protein